MRLRALLAVVAAAVATLAGPAAPPALAVPCFPTARIGDAGWVPEYKGSMKYEVTVSDPFGCLDHAEIGWFTMVGAEDLPGNATVADDYDANGGTFDFTTSHLGDTIEIKIVNDGGSRTSRMRRLP